LEEGYAMGARAAKSLGLSSVVAGVGVIVFALLVGFTKEGGGPDWVSIITAIAGVLLAGNGLYILFRKRGTGPASPHPAS
jgi:hypothetical protein